MKPMIIKYFFGKFRQMNFRYLFFALIKTRIAAFAAMAFILYFGAAAQNASAATFTVTRSDDRDQTCASGTDCSLREAVKAANLAATDDTIDFASGLTLITLASGDDGDIRITDNGTLNINGPGANILTVDGGAGINRIFGIDGATVAIFGITMQNGNGIGFFTGAGGGAILVRNGSLALDSVVVKNNGGDAVPGGGVAFMGGANHSIINSTFSGNSSFQCGALYNGSGTLAIANSTFSGNTAAYEVEGGGAMCNGGGLNIRNSTIAGNSATSATSSGGGILNFATLDIANTIIAGNTAAAQPEIRNKSAVISKGNNLIGDSAGDAGDTFDPITYQTAAGSEDILNVSPMLGALANNGGATPTRALLAGSPAIDKGNNIEATNIVTFTALTTDQRGLARKVDGDGNGTATVDIGAFEAAQAVPTAANVAVGGRIATTKGRGVSSVNVTMTAANGETRDVVSDANGYFRFVNVPAGATYVFTATAKRFQFAEPMFVRTIMEDADDVDFTALDIRSDDSKK